MHCPDCGKSNPAGSIYCNFCGRKLPQLDVETTVKCPYCGEPGQEYLFNCSKCGKELPRDKSGKPALEPSDRAKKFCRFCGKELGPAVTTCPYCGNQLVADVWSTTFAESSSQDYVSSDFVAEPRVETSTPIIAGVCLVIAGVLALGQGAVYVLANNIAEDVYGTGVGNLCFCGSVDILFGLAAIGGAFSCFGRGSFMFAIVGAVLGMLGLGFLIGGLFGLIGLILVAVSRNEFE